MKAVVFKPGIIEGSIKDSILLKFPEFSLSIIRTENGIFAEITSKNKREVFKGNIEEENLEKEVNEVMKRIHEIIQIYQNE